MKVCLICFGWRYSISGNPSNTFRQARLAKLCQSKNFPLGEGKIKLLVFSGKAAIARSFRVIVLFFWVLSLAPCSPSEKVEWKVSRFPLRSFHSTAIASEGRQPVKKQNLTKGA